MFSTDTEFSIYNCWHAGDDPKIIYTFCGHLKCWDFLFFVVFFKEMKFYNFSFRLGKGNVFPRGLMTRLGRWMLKALLEASSDVDHKAGAGGGDSRDEPLRTR